MGEFAQCLVVEIIDLPGLRSVGTSRRQMPPGRKNPRLDKFLTQEKSSSSSSSSSLPTPVSPAWFDPEAKSWYGRCLKMLPCVSYSEEAPGALLRSVGLQASRTSWASPERTSRALFLAHCFAIWQQTVRAPTKPRAGPFSAP